MRCKTSGLLFIAALTGCAFVQPHIPLDNKPVSENDFHGNLPSAINASMERVKKYQSYANQHSQLRDATTLALVPLTAFTMYKGLTAPSDSKNQLIALGLGGASISYAGSQFYSKDRQRLYLEAASAIICVTNASRPYLVTKPMHKSLTDGAEAISKASAPVDEAVVALLKTQREVGGLDTEWSKRITTETVSARSLVTRAGAAKTKTLTAIDFLDRESINLDGRVNAIELQLQREVVKSEPDLRSVGKIKDALSSSLASITPAGNSETGSAGAKLPADSPEKQNAGTKEAQQIRDKARSRVDADLRELSNRSAILAAALNEQNLLLKKITSRRLEAIEAMKQCDTDISIRTLAIQPDVSTMTLSQEMPRRPLEIKNGKLKALSGGAEKYLEVISEGGTLYSIALKGGKSPTEDVSTQIVVEGEHEEERVIDITVAAAPSPEAANKIKTTEKKKQPPPKPAFDPAVVACVQGKIGLKDGDVDGLDGRTTQAAIKLYAKEKGLAENIGLSAALVENTGCTPPKKTD